MTDLLMLEPIALRPTPTPPIIPDKIKLEDKTATVIVQDVYSGEGLRGVPRGSVKKLRLLQYEYSYRNQGGHYFVGMKRTLHHFGLPTAEKQPNDIHLESLDVYVTDVAANPNKVEWVRFGSACKLPPILSKTAHIAYKVASLEKAIKDKNVIHQPCEPMLPTSQVERGWMNANGLSLIDMTSMKVLNTVLLDNAESGAANPRGATCGISAGLCGFKRIDSLEFSSIDFRRFTTESSVGINRAVGSRNIGKYFKVRLCKGFDRSHCPRRRQTDSETGSNRRHLESPSRCHLQ